MKDSSVSMSEKNISCNENNNNNNKENNNNNDNNIQQSKDNLHKKIFIRADSYIDAVQSFRSHQSSIQISKDNHNSNIPDDIHYNESFNHQSSWYIEKDSTNKLINSNYLPWTSFTYYDGTRESLVDLAADIYELFDCNFDRYVD